MLRFGRDHMVWAAIALAAFAQLLLFWPGIASFDIVYIYAEWVRHDVGDWHPPVLIRIWSGLMALGLRGTGPLLIIQLAMFWFGLGLLVAGCLRVGRRGAAWALLIAALLPPVFGWMTEVVKDSQMTGALVAAVGLVGHYRLRSRPMPRLAVAAAGLALVYATLLRPNALFASLPLSAMLVWQGRQRPTTRTMLVGVLLLVVAITAPVLNRHVFDARAAHAERSQQLFDEAGIAHHAGLPSIAGVPAEKWTVAERHGCYTPFAWDSYSIQKGCTAIWAAVRDRSMTRDWIDAIIDHPLSYLAHRITHWNLSLRFIVARGEPRGTTQEYSTPNPWHLGSGDTTAPRVSYKIQKALAATPLGWPFIWLSLGLALVWITAAMPRSAPRDLSMALATSGVAQAVSLLFFSVAADQRYHAWPITAIALATAILMGERLPRRRAMVAGVAMLFLCGLAIAARLVLTPNWPPGF